MEPADKRGGWLDNDCKMVVGAYGIFAITGLTGAMQGGWFSRLESESEEYVQGWWT